MSVPRDPEVLLDVPEQPAATAAPAPADPTARAGRPPGWLKMLRDMVRQRRTQVGLAFVGLIVLIALVGPAFAPNSPTAFVGPPSSPPSPGLPLGTDLLGRDVLSRFLDGGGMILGISLLATVLGVAVGALLGMFAAYVGGRGDETIMRALDVVLSFPAIILPLLFISMLGNAWWLVVLTVALAHAPRVARVVRGATLQLVEQDFVAYARGIGIPRRRILLGDLLPNVTAPLTVEFGLRMTYSIGLVAALAYLGFGAPPPAPDWGSMINENQIALTLQPWPVVVPVIAIALLTVGMNLMTDGFARVSAGIDRGSGMIEETENGARPRPAVDAGPSAVEDAAEPAALEIVDLRVDLEGRDIDIVADIDLRLAPGEVLGLVGESGSGKTTVAHALLGHTRTGAVIAHGSVVVDGVDVLTLDKRELRRRRGRIVSYVPQDPTASLNPALRIGTQVMEVLEAHAFGDSDDARSERVAELMEDVRLPADRAFLNRYPHQLSGGQQQRVCLAMAFACRPQVVVLDEPTTGLDVTTQAHVLRTVKRLCETYRTVAVYVTHDLAVVNAVADRIAVMYAGRLVEVGVTEELIHCPAHPYTRGLVEAIPDPKLRRPLKGIPGRVAPLGQRPSGCPFAARCEFAEPECRAQEIALAPVRAGHRVRCRRAEEVLARGRVRVLEEPAVEASRPAQEHDLLSIEHLTARYGSQQVLHDVDLVLQRGGCTALVGETGSGKSTLARCVAGLHREATGEMRLGGTELAFGSRARPADVRRSVQYIFQNPHSSLNPRKTVEQLVARPLEAFDRLGRRGRRTRVEELLEHVALDPALADRYPSQLSGGEKQRVAIARALAADPVLVVCDEITSALDVSVQASVLELLARLQAEAGLTLLFATHNLGVVRAFADRVAVLDQGRIVEHGPAGRILDDPQAPYTRTLLADTPSLDLA